MKKIFFMSIVASMLIISNSAATENNDTNKSLNQDSNISIDGNITVSDANTSSIDTNTTANLDKPALNIDIKKGEELYKKCTMCHGKKAEMSYLKKIPVLIFQSYKFAKLRNNRIYFYEYFYYEKYSNF